jgi:hypothetical protein
LRWVVMSWIAAEVEAGGVFGVSSHPARQILPCTSKWPSCDGDRYHGKTFDHSFPKMLAALEIFT